MSEVETVTFKCPEGHVIEKRLDEIKDAQCRCDKCNKVYKFRKVELR
jgi:hypothetical protein